MFASTHTRGAHVSLFKPFKDAKERADITDFKFHDLRHSAASELAMRGASMVEIAHVLGHRTLAMVQRYSHISAPHTASVVAKMNAEIFGGDSGTGTNEGN